MLLGLFWAARVVLECVFVQIVGCLGFKALKWSARSRLNGWLCPTLRWNPRYPTQVNHTLRMSPGLGFSVFDTVEAIL